MKADMYFRYVLQICTSDMYFRYVQICASEL